MLRALFALFFSLPVVALQRVEIAVIIERPTGSIDTPKYLEVIERTIRLQLERQKKRMASVGVDPVLVFHYVDETKMSTHRATKQVLAGKEIAAIGLTTTDEAAPAAPLLRGSDLLVISPFASGNSLLEYQPNLLLFIAPNRALTQAFEVFVNRKFPGKKRLAIITIDSPYTMDFFQSLSDDFVKGTHVIKTTEPLDDLDSVVATVLNAKPDVVLLPTFPVVTASLIRALVAKGFQGAFVGPDSWGEGTDPRFKLVLRETTFRGYTIRPFSRLYLPPAGIEMREAVNAASEDFPASALAYADSLDYILSLLEKALPHPTRKKILELSKKKRTFEGKFGTVCFSSMSCPGRYHVFLKTDGHKLLPGGKIFTSSKKVVDE